MKILGKTPADAVRAFSARKSSFLEKSEKMQISQLTNFLMGYESERFAAEPVYAPTGKGFLKSKGVQGYVDDKRRLEAIEKSDLVKFRDQVCMIILEEIGITS